jgi:hypothetical protein
MKRDEDEMNIEMGMERQSERKETERINKVERRAGWKGEYF